MIFVSRGEVKHNGVFYGMGQALPKMSRAEELRLLNLGVCVEGIIPKAAAAPVGEKESAAAAADVDLNVNPDEIIKAKA